ncbi:DUF6049 family protein [Streptomyces litchfieldiae]|uniref:DUF6049 family protein n=1 Tax=Streptomyces litchfieldiae TaxID=3075543 RepID=A0ABU2MKL9_9ACTN|nr:DUF6049 family protein [Streptomyces sp. DSM 44938]MDT0342157.1 DUF6049 family protein [Streptomyces sp. DSM 44938]
MAVSRMRGRGSSAGRGRRLASLLAVVVSFPLLTGLVPTAMAAAPADDFGTGDRSATVAITEVSPVAPGEEDTLSIRGTITNEGSSAIIDSSVEARQGVPLSGRSAIDEWLARTGFDQAADGGIVRGHGQDIGTIEPGMSRTFSLQVPVSALALGDDGVYQLGVGLTGQREDARWDQVLGVGRTVLPWQPGEGTADSPQTRLTVLWPLISTTHLTAQMGADEAQTPAFRDESLLAEISPGGRLDQLVSLGADLPVTWVVDPDLLASVDAMTEEYRVFDGDELVNGDGQDQARAWLLKLEEAVNGDEVVALPFGDPDLASLAHQGIDVQGALGQLATATEAAGTTVETVLNGVQASTDFAWPVEGAIDPEIVSVATSAGAHHVITRSDSLRPGDLTYTPSAVRPIGGGTTAIVADARLSTLFEGDMTSTANASLAQQQLLAQTLAITQQEPANERSIVMAPQRMPSAAQAQAMADALVTLRDDAHWVAFADLSDAAQAEPDPAANQEVPGAGDYPRELRAQELPVGAFQSMRETQRTLEDFQVILTRDDRVAPPFGNAIRREMSVSWRGNEDEAAEYRSTVQDGLEELTERVHLIPKSPITLSGRSATIPVTVQNNLVQDVHNLELRLTSSRRLGLEVSEPQEITISGGHSQSVKFSTTARANGVFYLEARLYADGKPYGEPMRFRAEVTSITSEVMMVIAGGVLLVVLAGIRMYTQRKRAARQPAGAGVGARENADAPEGETGADTGGGATGTPSRGERLDSDE